MPKAPHICDAIDCDGEFIGTGHGITTMETAWVHRCDTCGKEAWAANNYPCYTHVPI